MINKVKFTFDDNEEEKYHHLYDTEEVCPNKNGDVYPDRLPILCKNFLPPRWRKISIVTTNWSVGTLDLCEQCYAESVRRQK